MSPIGCNCGKNPNNQTTQWQYSTGNKVVTYKTQVEARAAQIRNGNAGTVTEVAK